MAKSLTSIALSLIKETFLLLSESILGRKSYAMAFLKALISINESNHRIEKSLSKLVREPFSTAVEQFKIGCKLEGASKEERLHRESRFRDSLTNFDKALSLGEPNEKAFINLMRGLCAANLPGGETEAKIHFEVFQKECEENALKLKREATSLINAARENELRASEINLDELPKGLGGGTFFCMSVGEPKMKKATLLVKAREDRKNAERLLKESNVLLIASENLMTIIENT